MSKIEDLESSLKQHMIQLENEADNKLKKIRFKGKKLIQNTNKRLSIIKGDGAKFEENITPDSTAQEKYSHKISEVVLSTVNSIDIPENITKSSLNQFATGTREVLFEQDQLLIKYVSLLKEKSYKDRVNSLGKSLKRLNKELIKLEEFIIKDYTPNAHIEDVAEKVKNLVETIDKYYQKYDILLSKEEEMEEKVLELYKISEQIAELEANHTKVEYQTILELYSKLQRNLDSKFSNIRKAMRKQVNLISKSKTGGDTTLLKEFITDASATLANQTSIMSVKNMLEDLDVLMSKNALGLKKEKRESAREDIKDFLGGDLESVWKETRELTGKRNALSDKLKELELEAKIDKINSVLNAARRDKNRIIEREIRDIRQVSNGILKQYEELQSQKIYDLGFNENLQLLNLPEWANIDE